MTRAWGPDAQTRLMLTRGAAGRPGARTAVDLIADTYVDPEVDYMPPVNPDRPDQAALDEFARHSVPTRVLAGALADMLADRDRARGESGLLAPVGSTTAELADRFEGIWRATHPGYAEFLDLFPRGVR